MPDGLNILPDARPPAWWNGVIEAVSYGRFSGFTQRKGNSTVRQDEMSEEYARRYGLEIRDSFFDAALSGFHGDNSDIGDLRRLLDMAKAGRFRPGTHLLVESFDRLTRQQVRRAQMLFNEIIDRGLVVHTLGDEEVYWAEQLDNDPIRIIVSITIMMRGHNESKEKRRRSLDNMERSRLKARIEKVPFAGRTPAWIDVVVKNGKRRFVVNDHALTVKRIYEEAARGLTIIEITVGLNRDRVRTFGKNARWGAGSVQKILANDAVAGWWQPHQYVRESGKKRRRVPVGDPVEDYFPVTVPPAIFRMARENIENRRLRGKGRHGKTYANLVKGLCSCSVCDGPVYHQDHGNPNAYLRCYNSIVGCPGEDKCSNKASFPYRRLEPLLYRLHEVHEAITRMAATAPTDHANEIAALETRLDKLVEKNRRLADRWSDGEDGIDELLDSVKTDIRDTRAEIDRLKAEAERIEHNIERISFERFYEAKARVESENADVRRQARMALAAEYQRIIDRVILNTDGTLSVRIKRRLDGVQINYLISPERVETWWAERDGKRLNPPDLFFDSSIPMEEIAEMAHRHTRALSHDLYELAETVHRTELNKGTAA
jgi:hypothetical protein